TSSFFSLVSINCLLCCNRLCGHRLRARPRCGHRRFSIPCPVDKHLLYKHLCAWTARWTTPTTFQCRRCPHPPNGIALIPRLDATTDGIIPSTFAGARGEHHKAQHENRR